MTRVQAVAEIEALVAQATRVLVEAATIAREHDIPFEYDLTGNIDDPADSWSDSGCSDYWESSSC
ncbi:hypothetical protein D3C85_566380 [compost metagenome]